MTRLIKHASLALLFAFTVTACAEVGSEAWCNKLKEQPSGDWTANEAADYTKHCLLK